MGASRLTDAYLPSDPPGPDELSAALSIVELHIDDVRREVPGLADALGSSGLVIGVGGTLSTMAAVEIGLPRYDRDRLHGFVLDRPAAEDVFRTLATESAADRAFNPGLEADRVDLIVGGACVVVETMRQLDIDQITVSQTDLIDAVAAELLESR
jgi:exopolyphosphatase/guanosine-5'-triphosphate,3'-diphosphate pyrophosphatase